MDPSCFLKTFAGGKEQSEKNKKGDREIERSEERAGRQAGRWFKQFNSFVS